MITRNLPPALESNLERRVVDYAKTKYGMSILKLNVLGRVGWPDRMFLYKGRVAFIEFKRQNEKPRRIQEYVHAGLRRQGFDVYVVDNVEFGNRVVDSFAQDSQGLL